MRSGRSGRRRRSSFAASYFHSTYFPKKEIENNLIEFIGNLPTEAVAAASNNL
jgi:hypothetical protein